MHALLTTPHVYEYCVQYMQTKDCTVAWIIYMLINYGRSQHAVLRQKAALVGLYISDHIFCVIYHVDEYVVVCVRMVYVLTFTYVHMQYTVGNKPR